MKGKVNDPIEQKQPERVEHAHRPEQTAGNKHRIAGFEADRSPNDICVVILTFNSERSLPLVIDSCRRLGARIVIIDSFSTDRTVAIAHQAGCEVLQHAFENYSRQRNWSQEAIGKKSGWYLHLDSDEVLTPELAQEILFAIDCESPCNGYLMRRRPYFMGRPIRHGVIGCTWHLRLYRVGCGRCEDREYDQHYVAEGEVGRFKGSLLDLQMVTIEGWTASHNRWSTAEAVEIAREVHESDEQLPVRFLGDPRMRKRWLKKNVWYRMPLLVRPLFFFVYSYFFRLGFLDGRQGIVYHVLQAFWFRFLVDAKLLERKESPRWFQELVEKVEALNS